MFARRNGGGFELDVRGGLAPMYLLQSSSDCIHWTNVMSYSNLNAWQWQYQDSSGARIQFYRLVPAQ